VLTNLLESPQKLHITKFAKTKFSEISSRLSLYAGACRGWRKCDDGPGHPQSETTQITQRN